MTKKYSIAEIAQILGVSRTAVNRKIEKHGFETVQEYVNGRPLKLILLSGEQLAALKHETEIFKGVSTDSYNSDETFVNISTPVQQAKNIDGAGLLIENIMKHNETVLNEIRYYADTVINTERNRVKLLEDSEKRKDERLIELMAENKFLKEKVAMLEAENQQLKQKSFFGIKIK